MTDAALILCGGSSRRMGTDKAALPFGDETLLERIVRLVCDEIDEVWLVARENQQLAGIGRTLPVARDPAEGLGPLAGVTAGLRCIEAERAFVISCDTPLLQPGFASHLLSLADGHAAAVPRVDGHLVPTTAVYGKVLLPAAEALLARGELRPRLLVEQPGVRIVSEAELRTVDPELLSLHDCDTPDDYRSLLERAGLDPSAAANLPILEDQ
jgi:molybdopterin-guanine dinucleotide biosynthesis protein A